MKVIIQKIKIKNFKGILDKELVFNEKKNIIEGENGIGKTTILDGITWCLFGKNFEDKQQFKIKPIIDGEEKKDLATSVELTVNDKVIERIWDKDSTTIKVDGVKFGNREFEEYLRDKFEITNEEFKALSNIAYIPKLPWKDLRNLIMGLVGEISNDEVYAKGDFSLIKEKIDSVGVEKTAENLTETKSALSNDIKKILGNIDQKTKDIQELVIDENEQKDLLSRKEKVKQDIDNYNSLIQQQTNQNMRRQDLENAKNDIVKIDSEITKLQSQIDEYQKTYDNSNVDVNIEKENKIKSIDNKIKLRKDDIKLYDEEETKLIVERADLKKLYDEELAKEPRIENDKCSVCGQVLPQNKIDEALKKAKQLQIDNANGYARQAKLKLERINEIKILIKQANADIDELEKQKLEVENTEMVSYESDIQILMKKNIEKANADIVEYRNQKAAKQANIDYQEQLLAKEPIIEVSGNINDLQTELEEITKKMAVSDTLAIFRNQLAELEEKHANLIGEKELLNEKEQQLIAFNNTKAEMLREKVKDNFKLADFITQETTKDGKLIETFKIAINGIEYSSLNTGHKILVALDLIDNIQRLKNKRLPILVDGLGELTRLPELDTQIIGCRAKFQLNKKMELVEE